MLRAGGESPIKIRAHFFDTTTLHRVKESIDNLSRATNRQRDTGEPWGRTQKCERSKKEGKSGLQGGLALLRGGGLFRRHLGGSLQGRRSLGQGELGKIGPAAIKTPRPQCAHLSNPRTPGVAAHNGALLLLPHAGPCAVPSLPIPPHRACLLCESLKATPATRR